MSIHEKAAAAMPRIQGLRCTKCDRRIESVSLAQATVMLRTGWPKCCGFTMHLHTKNDPMPRPSPTGDT
jgi:hypothetical protein